MTFYADVALRQKIPPQNDGLFTYRLHNEWGITNENKEKTQKVDNNRSALIGVENKDFASLQGSLVTIPFQGERKTAILVRIHQKKPVFETEEIISIDSEPLLGPKEFELATHIAKKNFVPLARVLPLFLPASLFSGKSSPPVEIFLKKGCEEEFPKRMGGKMKAAVEFLKLYGEAEFNFFREKMETTNATIKKWEEKGIVIREKREVEAEKKMVIPEIELNEEQKKVLEEIMSKEWKMKNENCKKKFKKRKEKNSTTEYTKTPQYSVLENKKQEKIQKIESTEVYFGCTDEQKKFAITKNNKTQSIASPKQRVSLLFSPTGSGKSHLLRALAAKFLERGKTTLLLVPEIGLTEELVQKCREIFGENIVSVYHSKLSDRERAKVFWRIKKGLSKIIIGSRSALFLPFNNLGFVALEEEHEWSLKSDKSPRYHARDVAEKLAEIHKASFILSTATPSLETFFRAQKEEIQTHFLPSRTQLAKITFVDLTEETKAKNPSLISRKLFVKMKSALEKKEQILLLLNRRGLFRSVICEDCGEALRSPINDTCLVVHQGKNGKDFLLCHHSGRVYSIPSHCPSCGGPKLKYFGTGTAKMEQILNHLFPGRKVVRIDRDTTSKKLAFSQIQEQISSGKADILIGTQIIAKGLDFENIGLVGVLDADVGLNIPDFRASERTFQLLKQVAGRAGRRGQASEVIIQTRIPRHDVFTSIMDEIENNDQFYKNELSLRENFFLPPYARMAKLIFLGKTKNLIFEKARNMEKILLQTAKDFFPDEKINVAVSPALIPKKYDRYFVNVLLTAKEPEKILQKIPLMGARVDIDPVDVVG